MQNVNTFQDRINTGFAVSHLKALFAKEEAMLTAAVNLITANAHIAIRQNPSADFWWNAACQRPELLTIATEITEWLSDFDLTFLAERRSHYANRLQRQLACALRPFEESKRGYTQATSRMHAVR